MLHLRAEDAAQSGARFPMELVTFAQALAFPRGAVRVIGDRLADVGTAKFDRLRLLRECGATRSYNQ